MTDLRKVAHEITDSIEGMGAHLGIEDRVYKALLQVREEAIKERDAYREIAINMAVNHEWCAGSVELAEVTVDRKAKNLLERKGKKP